MSQALNDSATVTYDLEEKVAVIRVDDGKANALGHEVLAGLEAGLDRADSDSAGAIVILGREGKFSAGFDLSVMTSGPEQARDLLARGARLGMSIFDSDRPVILGVTGHALAMGAILLCCADVRVGADGPYKLGLNEVRIGMPVPAFAVELCRDRLAAPFFTQAVQLGHIHSPAEALAAGFLDELVELDQVSARSIAIAGELAEAIHGGPFRTTRRTVRGELLATLREGLERDMSLFNIEA
ncbi:MAG: crotonase/enoyl-CoA hydratase family protein [Microthrixaceae bacterium]